MEMEVQEVDSMIPLAMQWFQHTNDLNSTLQAIAVTDSDTFVLKVDVMELLEWNPLLAKAIMNDPDVIAFKLWNFIFKSTMDDSSYTLGKRMWLRFDSVPLPPVSADKLWKTGAARGPNKTLVHVYGVVYAATTVQRIAYMRRARCKGCDYVKDFAFNEKLSFGRICCSYGQFEEDKSASIYISSQEVLLGPVPTLSSEALPFPQLILIVLQDDLAGQVQIGDSMAVIGHAFAEIKESQPCERKCLSRLKVTANNIIRPFNYKSLTLTSQIIDLWPDILFLNELGNISLNALCNFLSANGAQTRLNAYSLVALLISLVGSENVANFHNNNNNDERKRIHIMLTSRGPCETLFRQLQAVAVLYGARSVRHSPCNENLESKLTNSCSGGTQILQSGSLSLSNDGIFLVDFFSCSISRSDARFFCQAMEKPSIQIKDSQDLCIPCRSTVWGSYAIFKDETSLIPLDFPKVARKGPTIDPELINKFEIILSSEEEEDFPRKYDMIVQSGRSTQSIELQKHLHSASNIKSTKISAGAHGLIRTYYLALRKAKSFIIQSDDVFSLQSLLRVASACARLCLRDEILEIPDATLAILLCEKTYTAKYGSAVMDQYSSRQLCDYDRNLDMEIKDFHHYLTRNLLSIQPSSLSSL
ncbi:uncharacterized protein LOC131036694 isoform X2 [Cryptomeria japonica]|uniref:uncharacterized protein LOC131036694 isoform X2 n=1 Tax=Cryptomeria japonica TaxID=3369 RepID=UPI0027DA20F9|nr:uncharacterized protein LOC131036694 isoform X2 [Cryptomeria japonica]